MSGLKRGKFIISLDFELMWGVRDKRTIESYGANIRGVREVIPALLQAFQRYDIAATFATVGFLFCRNKKELTDHIPSILPKYTTNNYSPYENYYLQGIGLSEAEDIYHYAPSLIKLIQQYPTQEIATHTYSHFYCLEGASLASFKADMEAAIAVADMYGIALKSIVFPRNQYTPAHFLFLNSSSAKAFIVTL